MTAQTANDQFVFNGDFDDFSQVEPYYEQFLEVFDQVKRPGRDFAYNDDFKGRISGIANTEQRGPSLGTHEDAAIYLLQGLRRQRQQDARVAELIADGYQWLDRLESTARCAHVVLVPTHRSGGEWAEYRSARVVADERTGTPYAILPKGARSNGHLIGSRKVLARI